MSRMVLATLTLAALAACGRGDRSDVASADGLNRDLQLAPVDTSATLNDRTSADTATSTTPSTPAPAPTSSKKETRELVGNASAPAPAVARSTPPGPESTPPPGRIPRAARTLVAVVQVPFGFDRADLDPAAKAALTPILEEMRHNTGLTIDLEGSTDAVGSVDYNLKLSERRVEAVRRYLLGRGVARARIVGSTARGPLADVAVKDDSKRRVMVKLMSSTE